MSTRNTIAILLIATLLAVPSFVFAYYRTYSPIHSNFQHTPNLQADDIPPGLPLSGKRILYGSITVAEVDGNSTNGKEILAGGEDGMVYVYHQNASLMWEQKVSNCAYADGDTLINTAPAVADIDGDGDMDVVVGYGTRGESCTGGVWAYDGPTGTPLWNYAIARNFNNLGAVISTPSIADVDGKGDVVIAFGSTDLYVYALNKNGTLRWRYFAMDTTWSSPSFADVNGDGRKDIIVGTDFTPGLVCNPREPLVGRPETNQGFLYAFDANAHLMYTPDPICAKDGNGTIGFDKGFLWKVGFDQSIYSSPVLVDIDNDNQLEIVVGASCFYPNTGKWVKIFTAATGAVERTLNAPNCVASSPAVGDIDGNGKLDIVAAISNGAPAAANGFGQLAAWTYDNPTPMWVVTPEGATDEKADLSEATNNPILADIDGNGSIEVILAVQNSLTVFRGSTGEALTPTCPPGGAEAQACFSRKSMFMWYPVRSTPAAVDLDNDGKLELVMGGSHTSSANPNFQNRAFLYVWRDFDTVISSASGTQRPYSAPWPMFKGNPAHTGYFFAPRITPSSKQISKIVTTRRADMFSLSFANADGSSINWSVTETDPSNILQLNRTSGNSSNLLQITIDGGSLTPGTTYNASLTVQSSGLANVTIPFQVTATSSMSTIYMPSLTR